MRSSYSGSVIGPKMSTCTLPRMFMPAPWTTRTLGIVPSVGAEWPDSTRRGRSPLGNRHVGARRARCSDAASLGAHVHRRRAGWERRTPDQILVGTARFVVADQLLRIERHTDGVRGEVWAREVRVGLVHAEVVDL